MESIIKKVTNEILAIATWSSEWNTYINCYVVKNDKALLLIDTASKDNSEDLNRLLALESISKLDINAIIATHGHQDHIGNSDLFKNASRFIHKSDIVMVKEDERECYEVLEGEYGTLFDFEWRLLGKHTPGSMVLYHEETKTLFAGDFICFFGFPLPQDSLVSEAPEIRKFWFEFISSGELSKHLRLQNVEPLDIAMDFQKLGAYDADYLCTGHGVVLKNNISSFLNKLSKDIIEYESKIR